MLESAKRIAKKAGEIIKDGFKGSFKVTKKDRAVYNGCKKNKQKKQKKTTETTDSSLFD